MSILKRFLNEQLTPHFKRIEFACPCCKMAPIEPGLVAGLEALRGALNAPVRINSGFRCNKHNQEVGGRSESRHLLGQAADIVAVGYTPKQVADECEKIPVFHKAGIGLYSSRGFVHVDIGPRKWRSYN